MKTLNNLQYELEVRKLYPDAWWHICSNYRGYVLLASKAGTTYVSPDDPRVLVGPVDAGLAWRTAYETLVVRIKKVTFK